LLSHPLRAFGVGLGPAAIGVEPDQHHRHVKLAGGDIRDGGRGGGRSGRGGGRFGRGRGGGRRRGRGGLRSGRGRRRGGGRRAAGCRDKGGHGQQAHDVP